MDFKGFLEGLKFSAIQVFSMMFSLFSIFLGLVFFAVFSLGLKSAGVNDVFNTSLPLEYIIPLFFISLVYSVIWYIVLMMEYTSGRYNIRKILLFSLLPNLILIPYFFYSGFFIPVDPTGCGFIYPRDIFYCLFYSLILFPLFVWGLGKWVFSKDLVKYKVINTVLLAFGLQVVLGILLMISVYLIESNSPPRFIDYMR